MYPAKVDIVFVNGLSCTWRLWIASSNCEIFFFSRHWFWKTAPQKFRKVEHADDGEDFLRKPWFLHVYLFSLFQLNLVIEEFIIIDLPCGRNPYSGYKYKFETGNVSEGKNVDLIDFFAVHVLRWIKFCKKVIYK